MGDFNIDLMKSETNNEVDAFLQLNLSNCIKPFITKPTRINPHSKTLIDNIFSNFFIESCFSTNLICNISDHLPQILMLDC